MAKSRHITRLNRGFTLIELLMTIIIIVILVALLSVAVNSARTAAQRAATRSVMTALAQATEVFRGDIGYLPPVLGADRSLGIPPEFPPTGLDTGVSQTYRVEIQDWYSITSPAEYLIGYGDHDDDGYGWVPGDVATEAELPALGIRHPGMDGVWSATDPDADLSGAGNWSRVARASAYDARGRVYGPYLELDDGDLMGRLLDADGDGVSDIDPVTGQPVVLHAGDPGYDVTMPMVIVDAWGSPIRYYRALYPFNGRGPIDGAPQLETGIAHQFPRTVDPFRPTLSDFFLLRPYEFGSQTVVDAVLPDMRNSSDSGGDTSTSMELQAGQYAYFSSGADRLLNAAIRADEPGLPGNSGDDMTDQTNRDNIVEVGP